MLAIRKYLLTYPINRFSKFELKNLAGFPSPQHVTAPSGDPFVTVGAFKKMLFVTSAFLDGVTMVVATRLERVITLVPLGRLAFTGHLGTIAAVL